MALTMQPAKLALIFVITLCAVILIAKANSDKTQASKTDDVNAPKIHDIQKLEKSYPIQKDKTKSENQQTLTSESSSNNARDTTETESMFQNSIGKVSNIVESVLDYIKSTEKPPTVEKEELQEQEQDSGGRKKSEKDHVISDGRLKKLDQIFDESQKSGIQNFQGRGYSNLHSPKEAYEYANKNEGDPASKITDVTAVDDSEKSKGKNSNIASEIIDVDGTDDLAKSEHKQGSINSKTKGKNRHKSGNKSNPGLKNSKIENKKEGPKHSKGRIPVANDDGNKKRHKSKNKNRIQGSKKHDRKIDDVIVGHKEKDNDIEGYINVDWVAWLRGGDETTTTQSAIVANKTTTTTGSGKEILMPTSAKDTKKPKKPYNDVIEFDDDDDEDNELRMADGSAHFSTRRWNDRDNYVGDDLASESKAVSKLVSYYQICDRCMTAVYNYSQQCPYYLAPAKEFEEWAREFSDVLRYGCPGQGVTHDYRCCHSPSPEVLDTVRQMTDLTRTLKVIMTSQCDKCPVDCQWSEWGSWSTCPLECQPSNSLIRPTRYRVRTRRPLRQDYRGRPCRGPTEEREPCPSKLRVIGTWMSWYPWSACSSTCGGVRHRTRKCSEPTECFTSCVGESFDIENCGGGRLCCQPRAWTPWGEWTDCTQQTSRVRWRSCEAQRRYLDQPLCPEPCFGDAVQYDDCCQPSTWGPWTDWTPCTSTVNSVDLETFEPCGKGCRNRTRECMPGNCNYNNDTLCKGDHIEYIFCNLGPCCEPPQWSQWQEWEACSVSIGQGVQRRRRFCQPSPEMWRIPTCKIGGCNDGNGNIESRVCQGVCLNCIPPTWASWGNWGRCDFNLSPPRKKRTRRCNYPSVFDERCRNQECVGISTEYENCDCIPPMWGSWGSWVSCNFALDQPVRRRTRRCDISVLNPDCRDLTCVGRDFEEERCICVPPTWASWGNWGRCDFNLSPPKKKRTRRCNNPSVFDERCRNRECVGISTEYDDCDCIPPMWGSWGSWGSCNFALDQPVRRRTRRCDISLLNPDCRDLTCVGRDFEEGRCICEPPILQWSSWGRCDISQDPPTKTRYQTCREIRRNPEYCKDTCPPGRVEEKTVCCYPPPAWSQWGAWSRCDTTKQPHTRRRTRRCILPASSTSDPDCHNARCPSSSTQEESCSSPVTCHPGVWSRWSTWSDCDCKTQVQTRSRKRLPTPTFSERNLCSPRQEMGTRNCADDCEPECQESCAGRKDGKYPSCKKGCKSFINCCEGQPIRNDCLGNQHYDSECKICVRRPSPTCGTDQYDIHLFSTSIDMRKVTIQ